jgi:N-acetylmuramic acid 6-phosphate etherase
MNLAHLVTEQRRGDLADLDLRGTQELVQLMVDDQARAIDAVHAAADSIATVIDAVVSQLRRGGRLLYVGAGTAGRMGLLDAAECLPTFNTDRVVGILAGGADALFQYRESVEDDAAQGAADLAGIDVDERDAVVGIAASGRTPYTVGAIDYARQRRATTIGLVGNSGSELSHRVDYLIEVVAGPEVIAGSTRLKAGTAQKIVLNTISTLAMVRMGKTFGDLMVDLRAGNGKLRDRAHRIVMEATAAPASAVDQTLATADGDVKVSIVMLLAGVDSAVARRRLEACGGVVRAAIEAKR